MNAEVRVMKTPAEQALAEVFSVAKPQLPGRGEIAALRERAFRSFDSQGLPHRRVEAWKYTDLRALLRDVKPLAAPSDAEAKMRAKDAGQLLAGIDSRRIVFVDGAFAAELSDLTPEKGLTITPLTQALANADALVTAHVGKVVETMDPAVALNTALMGDGAVIRIATGTTLARPIHLVFSGAQPASIFLRSLVVLEKDAKALLLETHESGEAQVNTALDVVVGDGAQLDHVKTTRAQAVQVSSMMVSLEARAKFNSFAFTPGSAVLRNQIFLRFDGPHAEALIAGATLLKGREHVDTTLFITHAAPHCFSRERFRTVLDERSHGVFQGKIIVEPQAQKTDAKMLSNALLLSDEAEADNKPELEIFADDVQCGHGATAGALDDNLLFYLRARGIPEKEAQALLIQAFAGDAIETVAHEGVREALHGATAAWLAARG